MDGSRLPQEAPPTRNLVELEVEAERVVGKLEAEAVDTEVATAKVARQMDLKCPMIPQMEHFPVAAGHTSLPCQSYPQL